MSYLTEKLLEEKVFKDPVHGYVHVSDKIIWDLIATKSFSACVASTNWGRLH